jgi:hypothetical protein
VNKHIWTDNPTHPTLPNQRRAERRDINAAARLTWKDQRGATRFASVITRNISEYGVYVECQSPVSIPMFRLVQFQLERDIREGGVLPAALRAGRVLSAVYRMSPGTAAGRKQCLALRLMIDPRRRPTDVAEPEMPMVARATAAAGAERATA